MPLQQIHRPATITLPVAVKVPATGQVHPHPTQIVSVPTNHELADLLYAIFCLASSHSVPGAIQVYYKLGVPTATLLRDDLKQMGHTLPDNMLFSVEDAEKKTQAQVSRFVKQRLATPANVGRLLADAFNMVPIFTQFAHANEMTGEYMDMTKIANHDSHDWVLGRMSVAETARTHSHTRPSPRSFCHSSQRGLNTPLPGLSGHLPEVSAGNSPHMYIGIHRHPDCEMGHRQQWFSSEANARHHHAPPMLR